MILQPRSVFPEIAAQINEKLLASAASGAYDLDNVTAFIQALTETLQSVSKDRYLTVQFSESPIPPEPTQGPDDRVPSMPAKMMRQLTLSNWCFEKAERLSGNIGYLDFRLFLAEPEAIEVAIAALQFLVNTSALIIDLRQNGGGNPMALDVMLTYFFDTPKHVNDFYRRKDGKEELHQFWTLPYVSGKRYLEKPIYVLTSDYTFSCAEEFAYDLQVLKRATIVGEKTGGGAHPGQLFRLHERFRVFIATGRAVNPITGTNWEGTGVEPDVKVEKEKAFDVAYKLALEAVLKEIGQNPSVGQEIQVKQIKDTLKELKDKEEVKVVA